jgi:predicted outer membrane repeat protein
MAASANTSKVPGGAISGEDVVLETGASLIQVILS